MSRIDLHAHTEHSDGTLPAAALVRLARDVGLSTLAVTDHDTTVGFAEAKAEGETLGVEVIPGCEVSTRGGGGNVHVLGLGIEPADASLQHFLAEVRVARERRNEAILRRLAALGVPVTREEVEAHVRGSILARPHFAQALVARGHVPDLRTAFSLYLRDGGPAYVEAAFPPTERAIAAIRGAGGAAVLAHPGQLRLKDRRDLAAFFGTLRTLGLAGIEVWHPSHDADQRLLLSALASEHDLLPSGGSDFHGDNKPHIRLGVGDGSVDVRRETWDRLRERRGPSWS